MKYQLKIQQLVSYTRCRIYRSFLSILCSDKNIRTGKTSYLYYFMMLCSLANFDTSTIRIKNTKCAILPGECIKKLSEMTVLLRTPNNRCTLDVLNHLQASNHITYKTDKNGQYIRFKINNWKEFNTALEADSPCYMEEGFFFFPYKMIDEFIGHSKCTEMDILLDLWVHTVYKDERVAGSDIGPVVYYRNKEHLPLTAYHALSNRWCVSKSTAGRILRKLESLGYLTNTSFPGKYGTAIYMNNYLSTMFKIADESVVKENVAAALNIAISIRENEPSAVEEITDKSTNEACQFYGDFVSDEQISVPDGFVYVPKSDVVQIVKTLAKILAIHGFSCIPCTRTEYILYNLNYLLNDCNRNILLSELLIRCDRRKLLYRFELEIEYYPDYDSSESEVM